MQKWLYIANTCFWLAMAAVVIYALKRGFDWPVMFFMVIPFITSVATMIDSKKADSIGNKINL